MINSKLWIRLAIAIAGAICIMGLGAWRYYWVKFIHPVEVFRAQELESIQYFDALNMSTLGELPNPSADVELISQGTGGILSPTNVHGRVLRLRYSIDPNSTLTPVSILEHYRRALIPKGWNESPLSLGDEESRLYTRGTACIEIVILFQAREYDIDIWHDFLSQEFSPTLPPLDMLHSYDYGKTDILTCPP